MLQLFVALDVSDDDVALEDIAQECGYDVRHPAIVDVLPPKVACWHDEPCLQLQLLLGQAVPVAALQAEAQIILSHPSIASFRVLALQAPGG